MPLGTCYGLEASEPKNHLRCRWGHPSHHPNGVISDNGVCKLQFATFRHNYNQCFVVKRKVLISFSWMWREGRGRWVVHMSREHPTSHSQSSMVYLNVATVLAFDRLWATEPKSVYSMGSFQILHFRECVLLRWYWWWCFKSFIHQFHSRDYTLK